jgi:hypothetical protein
MLWKECPPTTARGTGLHPLYVVPSPTWPAAFSPQQYPAPLVVTVHALTLPTYTDENVRGVRIEAGLAPKLRPQQYNPPEIEIPHVKPVPALMVENVRPPTTWTGERRWIVVPSPSCPLEFSPQQ